MSVVDLSNGVKANVYGGTFLLLILINIMTVRVWLAMFNVSDALYTPREGRDVVSDYGGGSQRGVH